MRFFSSTLAILLFVCGGTFIWYQETKAECPVPLTYRLGSIDPSFDLATSTALAYLRAAEVPWEQASARDLFLYEDSATADIKVNFIYDERQQTADAEASERSELDAEKTKSDVVRETLDKLQEEYQSIYDAYQEKSKSYQDRLSAYNAKVQRYNDRGGAPQNVYAELEAERKTLKGELDTLSTLSDQLNELAGRINQVGEEGNRLVEAYNTGVNTYNATFGFPREFTQGDYQGGGVINVYKFSDEAEVTTVLVHEFGHALGIDHVAGNTSIMYYLLEHTSTKPVLSAADRAAFLATCGEKLSWQQWVREAVRTLLARI